MRRRSFLAGLLAAPAVVRASSLMPIYVPPLVLYGDGVHDDTAALTAALTGQRVRWADGRIVHDNTVDTGRFLLSDTVEMAPGARLRRAHLIHAGVPDGAPLLHLRPHPAQRRVTELIGCLIEDKRSPWALVNLSGHAHRGAA